MPLKEKKLSEEQQRIFDKITTEKKNIFFTGCAGTGKSFLVKKIIEYYNAVLKPPDFLAITASTGRAAFNIGGTTLHSFAGVGLGRESVQELISKVAFNVKVSRRWKNTRVIIIDEISMLDADFFDKLDAVAKSINKTTKPFGGIQLVLTGDLLQLPPVSEGGSHRKRIFQAECWKNCIDEYIVLWEVFRQSDYEFARILTCIRIGAVNDEIIQFIEGLSKEKVYESDSGPVNLYSTRAKADRFNKENLDKIEGETVTYNAIDTFKRKGSATNNALDTCPAPSTLDIKIGAQVMLIKNITKDLVNGTVGIVTGFSSSPVFQQGNASSQSIDKFPIVKFELADGRVYTRGLIREIWSQTLPTGEEIATRKQIPLILAWAVTIHKSQGQTIQRLKVDLSDIFESGQIYTALSRAVGPESLEVSGFDPSKIKVDNDSLKFCFDNDLI